MIKNIIIIFILTTTLLNAQSKKEETLRRIQNNPFIEAEKINDKNGEEIYKIKRLPSGKTTYKNFSDYKTGALTKGKGVDTTKIYLQDIDTTRFQGMYEYWMTLDIDSNTGEIITIADINKNKLPEYYGIRWKLLYDQLQFNTRNIYEYDAQIQTFNNNYEFNIDTTLGLYVGFTTFNGIYDINNDGYEQVILAYLVSNEDSAFTHETIYKINDNVEYPIINDFYFEDPGQINDSKFGNFDDDDSTDYVYFSLDTNTVKIFEYSPSENNFLFRYEYNILEKDLYGGGFSLEDVDSDGYADLGLGTIHGLVFVFEYSPATKNYGVSFEGSVKTYNAYINFNTNDIDDNGKKEMWVGGDAFYNGEGITRITCFEATGDNNFHPVHVIDIHGVFSFDASNAQVLDVDKDGKDEILLCLDFSVYILKFTGEPDNPSYKLFYFKYNNFDETRYVKNYESASLYDIDNDGFEELLISGIISDDLNKTVTSYTDIYKPGEAITGVEDEYDSDKGFELYANYPNPFNPNTKIIYEIPKRSAVNISVYNILGEKVKTLVNKEQSGGKYTVSFEGADLPSGVYLISLSAENETKVFRKTVKAVLIK